VLQGWGHSAKTYRQYGDFLKWKLSSKQGMYNTPCYKKFLKSAPASRKHNWARRTMFADTACSFMGSDVGDGGFQFIQVQWVIAVGSVLNIAPLKKKSDGDKSCERWGQSPFEMIRSPKTRDSLRTVAHAVCHWSSTCGMRTPVGMRRHLTGYVKLIFVPEMRCGHASTILLCRNTFVPLIIFMICNNIFI
jgi:hypothetical protein